MVALRGSSLTQRPQEGFYNANDCGVSLINLGIESQMFSMIVLLQHNEIPRGEIRAGLFLIDSNLSTWRSMTHFGLDLNRFWNEYSGETLFFSLKFVGFW